MQGPWKHGRTFHPYSIQKASHFALHFYIQKAIHFALRFLSKIYCIVYFVRSTCGQTLQNIKLRAAFFANPGRSVDLVRLTISYVNVLFNTKKATRYGNESVLLQFPIHIMLWVYHYLNWLITNYHTILRSNRLTLNIKLLNALDILQHIAFSEPFNACCIFLDLFFTGLLVIFLRLIKKLHAVHQRQSKKSHRCEDQCSKKKLFRAFAVLFSHAHVVDLGTTCTSKRPALFHIIGTFL